MAEQRDAGIVEKHGAAAVLLSNLRSKRSYLLFLGNVDDVCGDFRGGFRERSAGSVEAILLDVSERERCAFCGELLREAAAHAGTGSGDHGYAIAEERHEVTWHGTGTMDRCCD